MPAGPPQVPYGARSLCTALLVPSSPLRQWSSCIAQKTTLLDDIGWRSLRPTGNALFTCFVRYLSAVLILSPFNVLSCNLMVVG